MKSIFFFLVFWSLVVSRVSLVGAANRTRTFETIVVAGDTSHPPDPVGGDPGHRSSPDKRPLAEVLRIRWPYKTIPVKFVDDYPQEYRPKVYAAMDAINKLTCVRLTNATAFSSYTVKVGWAESGCFSHIGYRNYDTGYQDLNLHPTCFGDLLGTVIHEFIHAIGFHHQQSRPDRDEYITIYKDRIDKDRFFNFNKKKEKNAYLSTFGLPYDYNSVMQYPRNAFSIGKGHVLEAKKRFRGDLGQRAGPSRADIAAINRMYECTDHYIGDDIDGAVPYRDFHRGYMTARPKVSKVLRKWEAKMKKLTA
ncbi:seminal metalloprotease 1-like [Panulirus ornatus]|uniref:seminal metalloprotease 1-like n=1 Tax=Panulirus ornatus TaxID=150431 RepID=UPI003A853302